MTDARTAKGGDAAARGIRVVLDARPLQAADRNPTTATYLDELLRAFEGMPDRGDSFLFLLDTPGSDPSTRYPGLSFAGRRRLPPTRRLRAASLTLDPFLIRAVTIGTGLRPPFGPGPAVLHVIGGTLPIASGLPMVVTVLDLAAWELPAVYQRTLAERFGQRLRVRLLRQAARIVVASDATARATARFLRFPQERIHVVHLAPTVRSIGAVERDEHLAALRERFGLPARYLLFRAQYDARKDLVTLLRALVTLGDQTGPDVGTRAGQAAADPTPNPWPPVLAIATPPSPGGDDSVDDEGAAAVVRLVGREHAAGCVRIIPALSAAEDAALVAGARAVVHPALVDGTGLPVIDALAAGVPVVASNVGALGELVEKAGILVPPRDARRLAAAITTVWTDERVHARLVRAVAARTSVRSRTWLDVAAETRAVYQLAASRTEA